MGGFGKSLGWILIGLSLLLHGFTVFCFGIQPDRLAAFTVLPVWFWGACGLFFSCTAFFCFRAPLSLMMSLVWAMTILAGSDEAKVLGNFATSSPKPGAAAPFKNTPVLRVLTLNCAMNRFGDPAADIARWNPDIVLLQEVSPRDARAIFSRVFGGSGSYRSFATNAILTRWKIQRQVLNSGQRCQQLTIARPDGSTFEVINIHLLSAATDLRFWKKQTWSLHHANRARRVRELSVALKVLESTTSFPATPVIFGGDFNAQANDASHRGLARDFVDSFAASGTGWGNTYQRRFPILRIDHIYATRHFVPVRSTVAITQNSDHRMVISDFTGGR